MDTELTNLLPRERQHALSRGYFLRLGVVLIISVTILVCIAGLLLIPTYVFLTQSAAAKQAHLANVESILASSNEAEISTHLAALSRDATVLVALENVPSASTILRSALAAPRPGISLSAFSYTPANGTAPGTLAISGIAATRDALRTYQLALQNDPFASAANLPVSAYAKDRDISFTISITLAP
ncbi:MAG: hypothetical protein AAB794_01265 [Patescibacteria group bacterium]